MNSKEALKKINQYWADINVHGKSDIVISNEDWNIIFKDLERLEKLEKVIEDIKQLPKCEVCDDNWIKGCMCFRKKLKEVLENE